MRRKKYMMATIAIIIIFISWNQNATASLITPLGTTQYNNYLQVDIISSDEINLSYVYSSIDVSSLTMDKLTYIPVTNTTRYLFTSNLYYPEYWEQLNQECFIFQDINSKNLYMVLINMSNVETPEDPWKIQYLNVSTEYMNVSYELNCTITNLTNKTSELDQWIEDFVELDEELNFTSEELNNITSLFINKSSEVNGLKHDLNITRNNFEDAYNNATVFRYFFEEMTSYKSSFNFKIGGDSGQYTTIYDYETNIASLENQIGGVPLILFFSIMVTMIICLMLGYWRWGRKRFSSEEVEMLQGVDPTTSRVNRFKSLLKIMPKGVKPKKNDSVSEQHENIQDDVDTKIKNIEEKIDSNQETNSANYELIMSRLDELLSGNKPKKIKQ